jgi:16S rRNA (cytosine1402-N4)-methyltransferase
MLPSVLRPSATDHVPVLADEVRDLLAVQPGETVVDGTFGAGGHSTLLAGDLQGRGKLIAIDRDPGARDYFARLEKSTPVQTRFLRGDFSVVLQQLAANDVKADAILLDLGISSMQVDNPERGFSYAADAPLDMRMDPCDEISAADLVNEWDERDLTRIFQTYGEERYARRSRAPSPAVARSVRSSAPATSSTSSSMRSRRPPASAKGIRRSACSRPSASPSTTSCTPSRRRCRPPSRCSGPAAVSR